MVVNGGCQRAHQAPGNFVCFLCLLTFIGLAHLRDATLLHVLFNLYNYVMLRYCTFSSIYTTTWCYATARSLQFTQLRDATLTGDATLLHVRFNLHNYVMLGWPGWGGWGGGWAGMLTFIGLAHLRDATLLHVLFNLHDYMMLCYCTFSSIYPTTWCYATARSLQLTQLRDATLTGVGGWGGGWVGGGC